MSFSPAQIRKFAKSEVNQLSPQISESIEPKSPWKIPIPYASVYFKQKLVEILDKKLSHKTLENKGLCLRNHSMSHKQYTTRKEVQKYGKKGSGKRIKKRILTILEEYFLAGNVDKSYQMTAQDMWNLLTLKAQKGEIESSNVPKVMTIQSWITCYTAQLCEKSAQKVYEEAN
ncbi:unnamed protein product [Rhizophagus irregularis]|nr:unnamed protein product [Rhizophagus irregularis]